MRTQGSQIGLDARMSLMTWISGARRRGMQAHQPAWEAGINRVSRLHSCKYRAH